jgi:hypothetical protein
MASTTPQPITFVVPGQAQPSVAGPARGRIKQSVRVGAQRGAVSEVRISATPGEDVVVLHIAGGPSLTLHPQNARDLLLAQGPLKRGAVAEPGEIRVPAQLQWRGLEETALSRGGPGGFLGDVLVSAIDVVSDLVRDPAADFVAARVVERFDGHVTPGLYALQPEVIATAATGAAPLASAPAAPGDGPLLVFVHGTFSDTAGTFGKLWSEHPQRVRTLFERYPRQVYGFDHPTLGASPIANALALANAMPAGARLHLVTHSRGGLVAEVLARVCAKPQLGADELAFFAGDAYRGQREELQALAARVAKQGIRVERVVRVACPARGTLLASKRLDAYLSVFRWTLELAGIPVAPALLEFLGEVAQRRADPEKIPGLAAQIPDSPLVQWLHAVNEPIRGELRVVAGDIEGDSVTSWLKTLMADAFYWADNDLVVQTRSMYGGTPRAAAANFVLDQGGKVSHFNYFSNERSAAAIVNALLQDQPPQGFRPIGPLSWAGESATGVRGPGLAAGVAESERPALFVLPGILGSNLKVDGQRIWLGWRLINGLKRLRYAPGTPDGVEPDGPIARIYDDLMQFLSASHEVIAFAFDWRRPIEEEARRLAAAVSAAMTAREQSGQPVRLLAHSMGGVLARTMQLESPEVWQRMMARPGARLLMLGTPNGGSWAPMQVLSGDDTFGNTLVAFGAPFQDHAARALMAQFPGFIQLQAELLDTTLALDREATWQQLADADLARVREHNWWHSDERQLNEYRWGVPPQDVLDRAVALRQRLDQQREHELPAFQDQLLLVVGHAGFTPDGYEIGDAGLVYLDAPEAGDGRVTLTNAQLPGVRTWQLDCEHGSLPAQESAFEAYLELLQVGSTDSAVLQPLAAPAAQRGAGAPGVPAAAHVRSRPSRERLAQRPPTLPGELLMLPRAEPLPSAALLGAALRVTVINGDLSFMRQPLLLGHYRALRLTGTERVVNQLIGGAMDASLKVGLYPDAPGTQQIFANTRVQPDNPWQLPRPEAVIVVGLGEEGKLRSQELVQTVRQAVIAWSQRMAEKPGGAPALFEIAATLIGSGGSGISAGQAARLIAQGVRGANERLADSQWPRVEHLILVELYLDRASEAWRALQVQATAEPGRYAISETVPSSPGALRRSLESGYRGADYDFISAQTLERAHGESAIAYTLDTQRARSEVRAQTTQVRLVRELVATASNDSHNDPQIGRTLFQLLVPLEMEPFLGGTTEMLLELDGGTAGIPWELLATDAGGGADARPWAIRAKLLRKLRTSDFRAQVIDASPDASVLVIGEPQCDPTVYPRLPGARREALAVVARLTAPDALAGDQVKALISPGDPARFGADARTVINALLERDWRIVHVSGHGEPPLADGDPRGVVLSNGTFLGPSEIRTMRVVPELVFVNCCHLAARSPGQLLRSDGAYDRVQFAAGVAQALIQIGVRSVIAAGWAVDDGPAMRFATRFYESLLRGQRFIDAVAEAREAAHELGGNTWAAYQCYGDPDWFFHRGAADAQRPSPPLADEFAAVASPPALALALETLAIGCEFQNAPALDQRAKIRHLEARFGPRWGGIGAVAEAFGVACTAAGDTAAAIEWYQRAVQANDASASMKAAEQLGNMRVRQAWDGVDAARNAIDRLEHLRGREQAKPAADAKHLASLRADIERCRGELMLAARAALPRISDGLALIEQLLAFQPSVEREALCGSAFKRLAQVRQVLGEDREARSALAEMKRHYAGAFARASQRADGDAFYPASNLLAVNLVLSAAPPDPELLASVRASLERRNRDAPDFWSMAGRTELAMLQALVDGGLAVALPGLLDDYADLHTRVPPPWRWDSVYDQARFVLSGLRQRKGLSEADAAAAHRLERQLADYAFAPAH